MTQEEISLWAAIIAGILLITGSVVTLLGAIGLLRFSSFYERVHAPTLGTTGGTGGILVASMIFFSVAQSRPILHEFLIAVFVIVTTPVTLLLLARAALYRDRTEGTGNAPPFDPVQNASE